MKPSTMIRISLLGACVAALSACGGTSSIFKDATFSTFNQSGDQYIQFEADINSSNVSFSGATVPVSENGQIIGDVELATNITSGTSSMIVQLDLSAVLKTPTPTYSGTLPNGLQWPVTGINLNQMMAFNAGTDGSKVYFYYDSTNQVAMVGAAIAVNALSTGTPVTLFSTFSSSGLSGVIGLYTGKAAGQSGVAFLANISQIFTLLPSSARQLVAVRSEQTAASAVKFHSTQPDSKSLRQIDNELYRMNENHVVIHVH